MSAANDPQNPRDPTRRAEVGKPIQQRLESLGLYLNEPERALLCMTCKYALQPNSVTRHVARHSVPLSARANLTAAIRSLRLPDPKTLPLRSDYTPRHPHLIVQQGTACGSCDYRTTSEELFRRHIRKLHSHGAGRRATKTVASRWMRDSGTYGLTLQSWTENGASGFWIVGSVPGCAATTKSHPLEAGCHTASISRRLRYEDIYASEEQRLIEGRHSTLHQPGGADMAFISNWTRRTGWNAWFEGEDRGLLVALAQLPGPLTGRGLCLRCSDGRTIESSHEDEVKLWHIVTAVDRALERCRDTVRYTDVSIRCWLRSHDPQRAYTAPFELPGRQTTEQVYARVMKRCICFCIRLWRLSEGKDGAAVRRSLTRLQQGAMRQIWMDELWPSLLSSVQPWSDQVRSESTRIPDPAQSIQFSAEENSDGGTSSASRNPSLHDDEDEYDDDIISSGHCSSDDEWQDNTDVVRVDPHVSAGGTDIEERPYAIGNGTRIDNSERDITEHYAGGGHLSPDTSPAARYSHSTSRPLSHPPPDQGGRLADLVLRLLGFLTTEEYDDGRASSTLLVYYSGVLGLSGDGATFERPRNYTPKLSAIIHCARLVVLEMALPRFSHPDIGWEVRPRQGQLRRLNTIRRAKICQGSQAPLGELLSLRQYGRALGRSDGPAFRVDWSKDGEEISWDNHRCTMTQFRHIGRIVLGRAQSCADRLLYSWQPPHDIGKLKDRMSNTSSGYSFVSEPKNNLVSEYLELSRRACLASIDGLMTEDTWDMASVRRYLATHDEFLKLVMLLVFLFGGQAPRGPDLLSVEHCNSHSNRRGIYVHCGRLVIVNKVHKARHATNREFYVARYLPAAVSKLLYQYLVYIRPFNCMLYRICLSRDVETSLLFFSPSNPTKSWKTSVLTETLKTYTTEALGCPLGVRDYRQLSIAITEKHISHIGKPFNRNDDTTSEADIGAAFAWQSGHRPLQRGASYGLDGAFPDSLQPALLQVYQLVSDAWYAFLQPDITTSAIVSPSRPRAQGSLTLKRSEPSSPRTTAKRPKRLRVPSPPHNASPEARADLISGLIHSSSPVLPHVADDEDNSEAAGTDRRGPWATVPEVALLQATRPLPWKGCSALFGRISDLKSGYACKQKAILEHIISKEAQVNDYFHSYARFSSMTNEFRRWRNVGCQTCFVNTGTPQPDHSMEECTLWNGSTKARDIRTWLEKLPIPLFLAGHESCSLCTYTDSICQVIRGTHQTSASGSRPGRSHCENLPIVQKGIAAIASFDEQVLGTILADRFTKQDGVNFSAENHVNLWISARIPFQDDWVPRLLFVFEMLVWAFDFYSQERHSHAQIARHARNVTGDETRGWDNLKELDNWRDAVAWWAGKCGFCAGRGLNGDHINHLLMDCRRGGAQRRKSGLGEAFFLEGLRCRRGCGDCGLPYQFCQKWRRVRNDQWAVVPSQVCQYGTLAYEVVVGLFYSDDERYRSGLLQTILDEGDGEYIGLHDEDVAVWLCRPVKVVEVHGSELIRILTAWTRSVQKFSWFEHRNAGKSVPYV